METNPSIEPVAPDAASLSVKIFGVGSAGRVVLEQLAASPAHGVSLALVSADGETADGRAGVETISVQPRLLRGLGTGGDPDRGSAAAEEFFPTLKEACAGAAAVFIVAGLGGGAGTGISPVLARAAKEAGALVLAFVTLPFDCEGNRRQSLARRGLEQLKAEADGVICLPNQKLFRLIDADTSVLDMFQATARLLAEGLNGVHRLLTRKGLIEIHFGDLCRLLKDRHGESCFATAEAAGATRSREAVDKLLAHPMLDGGKLLSQAEAVLVSLTGGPDLTMAEVNRVMESLNNQCVQAQVIMGAAIDEHFRDRLAITLVATGRGAAHKKGHADIAAAGGAESEAFLDLGTVVRPASRLVPPPPELSAEDARKLLEGGKPGQARSRKQHTKMSQGTLQLEIVSKGRFDKSEPTLHKGEDLDVPTYLRRGVSLN